MSTHSDTLKKFIKYWLPVIIYAIIIFHISSQHGEDIPALFSYQDVVFHIVEFAGFAMFLSRALKATAPPLSYQKRFFLVTALSLLYALSDEWHQMYVPQRFASWLDVGYDAFGIILATIFYR